MNRRDFLNRTIGAIVGGAFVSTNVEDKTMINPDWIKAGPERNITFAFNKDAFTVRNKNPWTVLYEQRKAEREAWHKLERQLRMQIK